MELRGMLQVGASDKEGVMTARAAGRLLAVLVLVALPAHGLTFTVNTTADGPPAAGACRSAGSPCTLREAVRAANDAGGPDRIVFDLPASDPGHGDGYWTIEVGSVLPAISEQVVIDGTSQPGSACAAGAGAPHTLRVRLDGNRVPVTPFSPPGFYVQGDDSLIRGLSITKFPGPGLSVTAARVVVECSYLGLTPDGVAAGNQHGIVLAGTLAEVGGNTPPQRNVLSGNRQSGIRVEEGATDNRIEGNYIGTDPSGTSGLPNPEGVLLLGGYRTSIGGTARGAGNVISGNTDGIDVGRRFGDGRSTAFETTIQGNRIGTDHTGTAAVANARTGINIVSPDTLVGGSDAGAGNVISGNGFVGVEVWGSVKSPRIEGNRIGIGADGRPLGNGSHGIRNLGVIGIFGGDGPAANTIAHNGAAGIIVHYDEADQPSAQILGNSIHSNGGLGIDLSGTLGADGVTPNDPADATLPAARNYPVLTRVSTTSTDTTIEGTLDSLPSYRFDLRFYSSPTADPSGHGEGETYLGVTTVSTDAAGAATFSVTLPEAVPAGHFVAATSTTVSGTRLTSEFSGSVGAVATTSAPLTLAIVLLALAAGLVWWLLRRRPGTG